MASQCKGLCGSQDVSGWSLPVREDDVRIANRFAVLRAAEEDPVQAVSVCRDPAHVPNHRRVEVGASARQNSQPVSKRLRLISRGRTVVALRILLHRPARGGLVPKGRLQERISRFARGE